MELVFKIPYGEVCNALALTFKLEEALANLGGYVPGKTKALAEILGLREWLLSTLLRS
jgi:hypothetical protein